MTIFTPAVLPEATPTVYVAYKEDPVAADYGRLQTDAGVDFPVLAAGKATPLPTSSFAALKIVLGVAAAADRVFIVESQLVAAHTGLTAG